MDGRPFKRNQMVSAKIERVSTHQRQSDHRAVHVGASGDILGDPPCNFSRFPTPEHPFYLARQGPRGTLNSTVELSLFLRRPNIPSLPAGPFIAGWCPARIHNPASLSFIPLSRVSRIRNGEARRERKRRKQRDCRCTRIDEERWRVDCLDPPRDGHRESPLQIDNLD